MGQIMSPSALWQNVDVEKEQLNINVVRTDEKDGITTQRLYFDGRSVSDGVCRVYACASYKNQPNNKCGVIIVGSYRNAMDVNELSYWAEKGFVAVSIDYAGDQRGAHTVYPTELAYCNSMTDTFSEYYIRDDARTNCLYEYAYNTMRAVSYIMSLGVKSVSVVTVDDGCDVGLMTMAMDKRVSNGTVVFGNVYKSYPTVTSEDIDEKVKQDELMQMWTAGLAPQSYVPLVNVPLYFVSGANSVKADVAEVSQLYYRTNEDGRILILPTVMDYLPEEYMENILRWCKGTLPEEKVEISSFYNEEGRFGFKLNTQLTTRKLSLWYCRNVNNRARNWVQAKLVKEEDGYVAYPDVYSAECTLGAFAVAEGNIALSTELCIAKLSNYKYVLNPTNAIFAGNTNATFCSYSANEHGWHGEDEDVTLAQGYLGITGIGGKAIATFATSDSCVRHNRPITVSMDVCCSEKATLTVTFVTSFGTDTTLYNAEVALVGDGKWQRVTVSEDDFQRLTYGKNTLGQSDVDAICFVCGSPIIINNVFLV